MRSSFIIPAAQQRPTLPRLRQPIRWRNFCVLFFASLIAQGLVFFRREPPFAWIVPALALEITVAGPLLFLAARRVSLKWGALYLGQIGVAFGGVVFFLHDWGVWNADIRTNGHVVTDALAVTAVGVGAAGLGILFRVAKFWGTQQGTISFGPLWGSWEFWLASYAITIAASPFLSNRDLGYLATVIPHWPLVAILALDVLGRTGKAPPRVLRWVWLVLVPLHLVLNFGTAFGMLVTRELIVLLFYLSLRRIIRIRARGVVAFAAIVIVVYAGRTYIRSVIWEQYETAPHGRLPVAWATMRGLSNYSWDDYALNADALMNDRIGHYTLIAQAVVVRDTPDPVPYLYGSSLYQFLWAFVPRAVYPGKPTEDWGQIFGHRYRLLHPADHATSFNFPQLTEAYANGGMVFVLVMMFLVAAAVQSVGLLTERLDPRSPDVLWVLLPLVFGSISDSLGNLTLGFNESLYNAIILTVPAYLAVRIRSKRRSRRRAPELSEFA